MKTFTDRDLGKLKERLGVMRPLHEIKPHMTPIELEALLNRLECAEKVIESCHFDCATCEDGHEEHFELMANQDAAVVAWLASKGKGEGAKEGGNG